jgi:DNA polymerase-3 subunit epsilon
MSVEAFRVHGLSDEFLSSKPRFLEVVDEFLGFIGDAPLIAHNADFDTAFLNAELRRAQRPQLDPARIMDSLALARRRFPAGPNSLDVLCSRFGIDLSRRVLHGALIDATLLGEVYIELIGGRQTSLAFGEINLRPMGLPGMAPATSLARPVPRAMQITAEERTAHDALMATIKNGGLWASYLKEASPS